jgi:transposase
MKKISTVEIERVRIFKENQLTIGLDLGDRTSHYCILNEAGEVILESTLPTTPKGIEEVFSKIPRSRVALETGTHSPWVSRQVAQFGHEVIVAHARNVRLIGESSRKDDQHRCPDAGTASPDRSRLVGSGATSQCQSANPSDGDPRPGGTGQLAHGAGECGTRVDEVVRPATAEMWHWANESGECQRNERGVAGCFGPAARGEIESLTERIAEYDRRIEQIAKVVYPQVAALKQVKGVGPLIALTFVLTLDDPNRFRRSRDVGCFVGLRPGRRNSGMSEPQLHISKEGDRYLRTLLVQGAHYILGPFGQDSDLRRWELKLAERGGKNAKKRAVVAVARKLSVLLHKLWVSGEVYEPLRNNHEAAAAVA